MKVTTATSTKEGKKDSQSKNSDNVRRREDGNREIRNKTKSDKPQSFFGGKEAWATKDDAL